jgi:hypothetical protein
MSERIVRSYDYVNHPYLRVRDTLLANPHYVFRHATAASTTFAATLHVRIGFVDVGTEVGVNITGVTHDTTQHHEPVTKLTIEWEATRNPKLFPTLQGTLSVFPLTPTETQLELEGHYVPPLGKAGALFDATLGHRMAEGSLTRFVQEVASWLREELTKPVAVVAEELLRDAVIDTE